jgi:hypothetical protein
MIVAPPVHGLQALGVFRELLALDAKQRGNQDAALTVCCFASELSGGKKSRSHMGSA